MTDGLVYAYAPLSAATSNSELNTTTGQPGSPWAPLGSVTCNADYPAVTSGPAGLGLLATNDTTLSAQKLQFRRFTPPAKWSDPFTVTDNVGLDPTVSQDSHTGGMYATFLNNDHGVQLASLERGQQLVRAGHDVRHQGRDLRRLAWQRCQRGG